MQSRCNCYNPKKRNRIHASIAQRYGLQRKIIFESDDSRECYIKETELITLHKTYIGGGEGWWGANMDLGGEGGGNTPKSAEHREKIRKALLGKTVSPEHRAAMSKGGRGKKLSAEHRRKIGESGRKAYENNVELQKARRRGAAVANKQRWSKPITEEQRARFSAAAKKRAECRRLAPESVRQKTREKRRELKAQRRFRRSATDWFRRTNQPSVPVEEACSSIASQSEVKQ